MAFAAPSDVIALAGRLFDELGRAHLGASLSSRGWTFAVDRARRRLGHCVVGPSGEKRITVARFVAQAGGTLLDDTLRHEAAHALDWETRGRLAHDRIWRRWAVRCGAAPVATCPVRDAGPLDAPYRGRCPRCGAERLFFRTPIRVFGCDACAGTGRRVYLRIADRSGQLVRDGGAMPGPFVAPVTTPHVGRCPSCGAVRPFARRPRFTYACDVCCGTHAEGRFDARFALVVEHRR